MKKRLFLFAGYNKNNVIDAATLFYIRQLSRLGDIIVCMDNDLPMAQVRKLRPFVLHTIAHRHGEYDFGSYKYAYLYARDKKILGNYRFLYLVNDSVYGPLTSLAPCLENIEARGLGAFGIMRQFSSKMSYIQSWFIGCTRDVFLTSWFDRFITSVKKQNDKGAVVYFYEKGFTQLLDAHGVRWDGVFNARGRGVYNLVRRYHNAGMPFVKKNSVTRCCGALGKQFLYVLNHIKPTTRTAILESAYQSFGRDYVEWFLTRNPIKILWRRLKHLYRKVFIEGI